MYLKGLVTYHDKTDKHFKQNNLDIDTLSRYKELSRGFMTSVTEETESQRIIPFGLILRKVMVT